MIRQGILEIVIEEVLWSIRESYQTIWSFPLTNVKWHSVNWPFTMTTPYWSDFVPNATFYRILSGFHITFATGVACRQGTLTPPGHLVPSLWNWHVFYLLRPIPLPNLSLIFPDYALRISLGTFSILLISNQYTLFYTSRFSHSDCGSSPVKTYAIKQTLLKEKRRTVGSTQQPLDYRPFAYRNVGRYVEWDLTFINTVDKW